MIHVNEIRFEGDTPWIKAFNEANDYWIKFTDESLTEEERKYAGEQWQLVRYELESGKYGNDL